MHAAEAADDSIAHAVGLVEAAEQRRQQRWQPRHQPRRLQTTHEPSERAYAQGDAARRQRRCGGLSSGGSGGRGGGGGGGGRLCGRVGRARILAATTAAARPEEAEECDECVDAAVRLEGAHDAFEHFRRLLRQPLVHRIGDWRQEARQRVRASERLRGHAAAVE